MSHSPQVESAKERQSDFVLLAHGLAAHRLVMRPLERHLCGVGYRTRNWGYRSIRPSIEQNGQRLIRQLESLDARDDLDRLHLVVHSMGSILTRYALQHFQPRKLHRIVMLGPPNGGSRVAHNLSKVLGLVCPPLHQLSDRRDSFVNQLPPPPATDIGIIAARHDRVVAVQKTELQQQAAHIVVPYGHTSMLFQDSVAQQVATFLEQGQFASATVPSIDSV